MKRSLLMYAATFTRFEGHSALVTVMLHLLFAIYPGSIIRRSLDGGASFEADPTLRTRLKQDLHEFCKEKGPGSCHPSRVISWPHVLSWLNCRNHLLHGNLLGNHRLLTRNNGLLHLRSSIRHSSRLWSSIRHSSRLWSCIRHGSWLGSCIDWLRN
jgi:hypothetical protein